MRFLFEDPWDRLRKMRKLVPNIPFQMLLRGANGVAYSSLPDNAIFHFCEQAKKHGVDIFRVFDALNDVDQLEVGVKAVLKAGGVAEGTVCYSGDFVSSSFRKVLSSFFSLRLYFFFPFFRWSGPSWRSISKTSTMVSSSQGPCIDTSPPHPRTRWLPRRQTSSSTCCCFAGLFSASLLIRRIPFLLSSFLLKMLLDNSGLVRFSLSLLDF
jgi:hypothetical protein